MSLSPNFGPRRDGLTPQLVVLHYTAMESCAAARARLCDPVYEVSAHWLISEAGDVDALVAEEMRAWHAGAGCWRGLDDINSRSIGIELSNRGDTPFAEPQMAALEELLWGILSRWQIQPLGVIGHSDMAPGRKSDPGRRFDWRRLARQGLSIWPQEPAPLASPDPRRFCRAAERFGYSCDAGFEAVLNAFRARFHPGKSGALTAQDMARIEDLAGRFGVDAGAAQV